MYTMKILAATKLNNVLIDLFDFNQSLSEIADKLISSGLINNELESIDYLINGSYSINYFDMTIEFTADNGKFLVELKEYEIK